MKKIKLGILFVFISLLMLSTLLLADAAGTATVNSILADATEYNGNYYMLFTTEVSWSQAKRACEGFGGHLATITSDGEDAICHSLSIGNTGTAAWIGATDAATEDVWTWVTGEKWVYENWGTNEPNGGTSENYAHMSTGYATGYWNDSAENKTFAFICEWEAEDVEYVRQNYGFITSTDSNYDGALYFNGHAYQIFSNMTSERAKEYCTELGGHLATITTEQEDKMLFAYVLQNAAFNCVFGADDVASEGQWQWVTGESFSYKNWNSGEPNNSGGVEDYMQFSSSGKWNDIAWTNMFMCEWDSFCVSSNGNVSEHMFDEETTLEFPTCTKEGKFKQVCAVCHVVILSDIEKKPHSFGGWGMIVVPTCETDGQDERDCIHCGYSEYRSIAATGHNYGEFEVVDGSKTFPPIVKERTCSYCHDVDRVEEGKKKNWALGIVVGCVIVFGWPAIKKFWDEL